MSTGGTPAPRAGADSAGQREGGSHLDFLAVRGDGDVS